MEYPWWAWLIVAILACALIPMALRGIVWLFAIIVALFRILFAFAVILAATIAAGLSWVADEWKSRRS